ncbi:hypothetical protein DN068_15140 [Taibaiella soli]|uniref:Outer membrane protein beta-barrel domain-containing protein n=1 Tax=Taibaiella soli TaxID=1649169 RepID=A0A2W2AIC0_9BACT|nr:hypothetical protein DN068_15140 [Taibaiella soli]
MSEAGEMKLTAATKVQNQISGHVSMSPSLDFSASPIKGLGLMVSFRNTNRFANDENWLTLGNTEQDSIHYSGNRFEFGAGYYMPFGRVGQFEIYAGGGFGSINRDNLKAIDGNFRANYNRIFIQPTCGAKIKDIVEIAGGMRFSYQHFTDFSSTDPNMEENLSGSGVRIQGSSFVFWEPFIDFSVGGKYAKFNLQTGAGVNMATSEHLNNPSPFYMSLGVTFNLAPRFRTGSSSAKTAH